MPAAGEEKTIRPLQSASFRVQGGAAGEKIKGCSEVRVGLESMGKFGCADRGRETGRSTERNNWG